jgi:drug/metabolite transporter (DMT)-like permease
MAPVLLAILFIGLSGPRPKTWIKRVLRWIALATGGLFVLLALIWVPYFYLAASQTSLVVDLALVVGVAALVNLVVRGRKRATEANLQVG